MSMAAPRYMSDPEYLKWFDFETDTFREGTPQHVLDMVQDHHEPLYFQHGENASGRAKRGLHAVTRRGAKTDDHLYPER